MNKLITDFSTYEKLLKDRRLKQELFDAVDYITNNKIQPKGRQKLQLLPVSIRGIPVALRNKLDYGDIGEYDSDAKVIILGYNYYNMHNEYDLLNTLIHEYGHAYLYKKKIPKLTSRAFYDQHEFFCQMLSLFYIAKLCSAQRNAIYAWCKVHTKKVRQQIDTANDFPTSYYKRYYYQYLRPLYQQFTKHYPPDANFRKLVTEST